MAFEIRNERTRDWVMNHPMAEFWCAVYDCPRFKTDRDCYPFFPEAQNPSHEDGPRAYIYNTLMWDRAFHCWTGGHADVVAHWVLENTTGDVMWLEGRYGTEKFVFALEKDLIATILRFSHLQIIVRKKGDDFEYIHPGDTPT